MSTRRIALPLALLAGLLFVVTDLAADNGPRPAAGATDEEIAEFWQGEIPDLVTWLSIFAGGLSHMLFLVFATAVATVIDRPGAGSMLARVAFGAAAISVAVKLMELPLVEWIHRVVASGGTLDPPVTGAVDAIATAVFELGWLPTGVFLLAAGAGGLVTQELPRWLSVVAIVDGAGLLLGYGLTTFALGITFWLVFLAWSAVASVVLARRAWRAHPSARSATAPAAP